MPRQANGSYVQPANTAAVSGQTISSTAFNTLETDIGNEITNSLDRGGRSAMTAALPMGANKITGMADPTNPQDASTKAYIDALVATFFSTGDVKLTLKTSPDSGWVFCDDRDIGSATSGAFNAGATCQALFTLLFNVVSDTYAPIATSGGGATTRAAQVNAATAWAANCRMSLTKMLGRSLSIGGTGAGLSARVAGQTLGSETFTLARSDLPQTSVPVTITDPGHNHTSTGLAFITAVNNGGGASQGNLVVTAGGTPAGALTNSATTGISAAFNLNGNVAQTSESLMQPSTYLFAMIKL